MREKLIRELEPGDPVYLKKQWISYTFKREGGPVIVAPRHKWRHKGYTNFSFVFEEYRHDLVTNRYREICCLSEEDIDIARTNELLYVPTMPLKRVAPELPTI